MSISKMIDYVMPMHLENVTVVPLIGGAGSDMECLSNVREQAGNSIGSEM